jgi:hypothetical protein
VDEISKIANADQAPAGPTNGASSAAQSEGSELEPADRPLNSLIGADGSERDDQVAYNPTLDFGVGAITGPIADVVVDNASVGSSSPPSRLATLHRTHDYNAKCG